jgi:nucleotide-binding universal stress UspA family protein
MFRAALVALDLAPAAAPIVDCLADLRQWGVEKLVLGHVIHVGYTDAASYDHEAKLLAWLEERAEPQCGTGLEVEVRAAGIPADAILAAATDVDADLVVIGSRSESRVKTFFLGSVARAVIHQTTLPLLLQWIEPTAEATAEACETVCADTLRHVLLATDFSSHAAAAEAATAALAAAAGRTTIMHVTPPATVEGNSIAHGHPIGATGALQTTRLVHSMRRDGIKRGIVTMCIGGGQGIALALEARH